MYQSPAIDGLRDPAQKFEIETGVTKFAETHSRLRSAADFRVLDGNIRQDFHDLVDIAAVGDANRRPLARTINE